jgi:hypothetical protein
MKEDHSPINETPIDKKSGFDEDDTEKKLLLKNMRRSTHIKLKVQDNEEFEKNKKENKENKKEFEENENIVYNFEELMNNEEINEELKEKIKKEVMKEYQEIKNSIKEDTKNFQESNKNSLHKYDKMVGIKLDLEIPETYEKLTKENKKLYQVKINLKKVI